MALCYTKCRVNEIKTQVYYCVDGLSHPKRSYSIVFPTDGRDVVVIRFYQRQRGFYVN